MPARAEQRRDDARHDRGVEAVFGRQPGQRRERDALRQHQQRAEQAGDEVGAHARAIDPANPRPEDACSELVHWRRLSARGAPAPALDKCRAIDAAERRGRRREAALRRARHDTTW